MRFKILQIKDVGWMAVIWSQKGLAALTLPCLSPDAAFESLKEYVSPAQLTAENNDPEPALSLHKELIKYFSGKQCNFNYPVDLSWCTPFQRQVLVSIRKIPYGETRSYRQVAEMIDKPAAVRAVGGALRNNRVILVLPCHRVIRSDGSLGGFGGIENSCWKQKFLDIERY